MTRTPERFFADGWRVKLTWVLAVLFPPVICWHFYRYLQPGGEVLVSGIDMNALRLLMGISFVAVFFCLVWGLAHLRRPVVSIGDDVMEFGSIFRFARRPVVQIAEIAALEGTPRKVRLRMRSGKVVRVGTPELSMDSRAAVLAALERRIGGDPP